MTSVEHNAEVLFAILTRQVLLHSFLIGIHAKINADIFVFPLIMKIYIITLYLRQVSEAKTSNSSSSSKYVGI